MSKLNIEIFTDKEMILQNVNDLSEKIQKISKDDKLRKQIARQGKEKYMKFFNSNLVAEYIINRTLDISNRKISLGN